MEAKENTEESKGGADTSPQGEVFDDKVRGQPPVPDKGILARYPLIFYFLIAYAGSWLVVLPYLRSAGGAGLLPFNWPIPFPVSATLAPFAGPCLAAFIMTGITEGSPGIRRLLRWIVLWRVGVQWYLFALVGIPLVAGTIAIVALAGDRLVPERRPRTMPADFSAADNRSKPASPPNSGLMTLWSMMS